MSLVTGEYLARGRSAQLGKAGTGTVQVAVELEVIEGNYAGQHATWFGFFTEKTQERTLESLRLLGWQGDDLSDLKGIDRNDVKIVVEEETYNGKTTAKVQWINAPGGMALKDPMSADQAKAFAAKMKATVIAQRKKAASERKGNDDPPF